jgi:hypothetical protein
MEQSSVITEQRACEEYSYTTTTLDHRDPVNSHRGNNKGHFPTHHTFFMETGSVARTRIAFGGGTKPSKGIRHHS